MKVYQTLAVAIFTFMTVQCQASDLSSPVKGAGTPSKTFVVKASRYGGFGHTPGKVDIQKLLDDKIQVFEVAESDPSKNSIIKNLLRHDDEKIFFTYTLLKRSAAGECKSGKCSTQDRAVTLLRTVNSSSLKMALEAKPDAVIILDKTAKDLDVASFAITSAEIASINQQLAAAQLAINTTGLSSPSSPAMGDGTWKSVPTASTGPFSPAVVAIDFSDVWNSVKASKGAAYGRDFYHDYFLKAAREIYKIDRQIFSAADGGKHWLDMINPPVAVDIFLGTGTINNDFPWLKEKNSTLQVIGYLSWLKDNGLEDVFVQRAFNDLKNILKGDDAMSGSIKGASTPEQTKSIGAAMVKIADWESGKKPVKLVPLEILNHFKAEYGVDTGTKDSKPHRFILAFASSLVYMTPKGAPLKSSSCTALRDAVAELDLQGHVPADFCASLEGEHLTR